MAKTIKFQKIKDLAGKMPKGKPKVKVELGEANLESKFRVQLTR
jgi:hypothetical protein